MVQDNHAGIEAIHRSVSHLLAEEDPSLLKRPELRGMRLLLEYLKPELIQNDLGVNSTIVVFGGSRIKDAAAAGAEFEDAQRALSCDPNNPTLRAKLQAAEHTVENVVYYETAREFARLVSSTCQIEGRCDYVIVTGGGPGIMEAANRGAHDVGAKSIGLNITIPQEQEPNPYITPELCFTFRYFAIRKLHFLIRAKALVAFPGGFGTLDELFEALTLMQTGRHNPIPIILFGRSFWERLINWDVLIQEGTIRPDDLDLFQYADSAQDGWDRIFAFHNQGRTPN